MAKLKSILILGSNGFIGAHLVSWFRDQDVFVIGIDQAEASNGSLNLQPPHEFVRLQLPDTQFTEILQRYQPDAVVNAAGPASVSNSLTDPGMDFRGSVEVCFHVLEALRQELPDSIFLQLSSAALYGNPIELPIQENAPSQPISPYGYHKFICETLVEEYAKIYKLQTCVARIFSAFGPGLRKQVLWDIYQKYQAKDKITLFGTGEETRDFIYVGDIVQGINLVLEKGDHQGNIYNLANGTEVSIRVIARFFLDKLNLHDTEVFFSGINKTGDPQKWRADIRKIQELGYTPKYDLERGLEEYAKWIKEDKGS